MCALDLYMFAGYSAHVRAASKPCHRRCLLAQMQLKELWRLIWAHSGFISQVDADDGRTMEGGDYNIHACRCWLLLLWVGCYSITCAYPVITFTFLINNFLLSSKLDEPLSADTKPLEQLRMCWAWAFDENISLSTMLTPQLQHKKKS